MTELIPPTPPMQQPDLLGTYTKVQNILIQRQEQEARRRALMGGAAAGALIQKYGFDPAAQAGGIKDLPPEVVPETVTQSSAATSAAIKAQTESAAANQASTAYMSNSLSVLLASHPNGIPTPDALAVVGSLNALKVVLPLPATAMKLELAKLPNDKARSKYIAEKLMASMGDKIWSTPVDVINPDGTPGKALMADIIAQATGVTPPRPAGGGAGGELPPGEAPATDRPTSGLSVAATGPSAAQANVLQEVGKVDIAQANKDLIASTGSPDRMASLETMTAEATGFKGGPFAGPLAELLAAVNQLKPGDPISPDLVAKIEAFNKTSATFAQQQSDLGLGPGATDMSRGMTLARNPRSELSSLGLRIVIHQLMGNEAAIKVKALRLRDLQASPGGLTAAKLNAFYSEWGKHGNPRVFQYAMQGSKAARDQMLGAAWVKTSKTAEGHWESLEIDPSTNKPKRLTEEQDLALKKFQRDHDYAAQKGWLDLIDSSDDPLRR